VRAVVQRVSAARVEVGGEVVGSIGRGLLVFLGAGRGDGEEDGAYVLAKVLGLRVFPDEAGKMSLALDEVRGELLVVSQFTLYGDLRRGRRPSFSEALEPVEAERLYERFLAGARASGLVVASGRFGADMHVHAENDGPVTLLLDSRRAF
jgi:D-tyrosyl-tRNA(Tyr) deacylase